MKRSELITKLMKNPEGDPEIVIFNDSNDMLYAIVEVSDERENQHLEDVRDAICLYDER